MSSHLRFDHCYMNLPVDAVEFLDAFIGLFKDANPKIWGTPAKLPMIHVYGFTYHHEEGEAKKYFTERIGKAMNYPSFKEEDIAFFHNIRTVSPQSVMYGVSFRLPEAVAFSEAKPNAEGGAGVALYEEFEDEGRKKIVKQ